MALAKVRAKSPSTTPQPRPMLRLPMFSVVATIADSAFPFPTSIPYRRIASTMVVTGPAEYGRPEIQRIIEVT